MKSDEHWRSQAKLNEELVLKILQDARTNKAIAADYGVSVSTIKGVRNGRTWKSVYRQYMGTELQSSASVASNLAIAELRKTKVKARKAKVGLPVDQLFDC